MDTSTVELVAALGRWAERAYQTCRRDYMQSPADAPLTEWAGRMTEQLIDLAGLLSQRLTAERARLAAAVAKAEEAWGGADAELVLADRGLDHAVASGEGRRRAAERLRHAEAALDHAERVRQSALDALAGFDAAVGKEAGR